MQSPDTAYRDFQAILRRYLARRLGSPDDVEDVLQDVFLRVTRNRVALETAKEPLAWLYATTKSALIDHLRRQEKHAMTVSGVRLDDIPEPPADAQADDFGACLMPLVENLPKKYREAVRFVDIKGGRQTDFAKQCGLSGSTARSHVQRGRRQLKSAILDCCKVERDARKNVSALVPKDDGKDCC